MTSSPTNSSAISAMAITSASGTCASAPVSASETCDSAHASRRTSSNTSAISENATLEKQNPELENMWESFYGPFCCWFSKDKSPRVSFELPDEPHSSTGTESISSPSKTPSSSASTNSVSIGEKVPFQLIASVWLIFIYCTVQQSHMTYSYIGTVLTEFLQIG